MENSSASIAKILKANEYPGRGIIIGKSADGRKAVFAYFIMGRSENSRNRVFVETDDGIRTEAFDTEKLTDPSLIIYSPVRSIDNKIIVTNGDQTDTIYQFLAEGDSFENALTTREFEPDEPNYTPRISGMLEHSSEDFSYKLSILKRSTDGNCERLFFPFSSENGTGHFIHTYNGDGNPLPSFSGAPTQIAIDGEIDEFTKTLWFNLNKFNKVSLHVSFVYLKNGLRVKRTMNKNIKGL